MWILPLFRERNEITATPSQNLPTLHVNGCFLLHRENLTDWATLESVLIALGPSRFMEMFGCAPPQLELLGLLLICLAHLQQNSPLKFKSFPNN